MPLMAGSATRVVNCEVGDDLRGQLYRRVCERIRDNLEANALYLTDGSERVLLVSLDLCGMDVQDIRPVQAKIESRTGVPGCNVLVSCTHTHTGPQTKDGFEGNSPKNEAYMERLCGALVAAAAEAVGTARPARVGWGCGRAHIGHNRRLCWTDGAHSMYGDAARPDFAGLEGPEDPSHAVLFAVDNNGKLIAILHNNCCHATCVEGALFASADFPGEARARIRDTFGAPLPVLYLQGASGDTSPWNMLAKPPRYDGEQRMKEIGCMLAGETLRLMREAKTTAEAVLRHRFENLAMAVRLPTPEELARAEEVKARGRDRHGHRVVPARALRGIQDCGCLREHDVGAMGRKWVGRAPDTLGRRVRGAVGP